MSRKHLSKEELHKDWLLENMQKCVKWIEQNKHTAIVVLLSILTLVVIALISLQYMANRKEKSWAALQIAKQYVAVGDNDRFIEELNLLNEKYQNTPANVHGQILLANYHYEKEEYDKACLAYENAMAVNKNEMLMPIAELGYIKSLQANKQYDKAIDQADKFLTLHANTFVTPEVNFALAQTYELKGDKVKAVQTFDQIVAKYPDTYWAEEAKLKIPSEGVTISKDSSGDKAKETKAEPAKKDAKTETKK